MSENNENFEVVEAEVEFDKMPVKDVLDRSKDISSKSAAMEILNWLDKNVENYVESESKLYKLNMVVDDDKLMPTVKRLQDLYRAIPDDEIEESDLEKDSLIEECTKCRRKLDEITRNIYEEIESLDDELETVFTRLSYYYEKVVINPDNRKRALEIDEELKDLIRSKEGATEEQNEEIQLKIADKVKEGEELVKFEKLEGVLKVTKFEYEAFNVGVKIAAPGLTDDGKKEIVKAYTIPEGFTIWFELSHKLKQRPTSMF